MILTRTPFRITLGGGGSDLPAYYRAHGGVCLTLAIDRYMYVGVNRPPLDARVRLHYSRGETVDCVADLRHDLAREALRLCGHEHGIEVSSMADLDAGSGMGSSAAYLVGLLRALGASHACAAERACQIEIDVLRRGTGVQDAYAVAFGGMQALTIARSGAVTVAPIPLRPEAVAQLVRNLRLYATGQAHDAAAQLAPQNAALLDPTSLRHREVTDRLHAIKALALMSRAALAEERLDEWGLALHEAWTHKRALSPCVSTRGVDAVYEAARRDRGVLGGKLLGAGGGGFLMLYCPSGHAALDEFMAGAGMPRLSYGIDWEGAKVIAS